MKIVPSTRYNGRDSILRPVVLEGATCIPYLLTYMTSQFLRRAPGDRPPTHSRESRGGRQPGCTTPIGGGRLKSGACGTI